MRGEHIAQQHRNQKVCIQRCMGLMAGNANFEANAALQKAPYSERLMGPNAEQGTRTGAPPL
jgi:hypothetical protein